MIELIRTCFDESMDVKKRTLESDECVDAIASIAQALVQSIDSGGKLILCGNGGSASDALHMAGEIVGRFQTERVPWPAVVLNADVATMTAIANDYGYEEVFARQAEAHVNRGDVFLGISSSGNSSNVVQAMGVASRKGALVASLVGHNGGKMAQISDISLIVPSEVTARIQEVHILAIHTICQIVEDCLKDVG